MSLSFATIDGVGPSTVRLPVGTWTTVLDFLVDRFPEIGAAEWRSRCARGRVLDPCGRPLAGDAPYTPGTTLHYYREVDREPEIPFDAEVLHADAHLLIADKPHFLPVLPSGRWVHQTLLVRLKQLTGLNDLVPLHRIDRGTAGLVAFSVNPDSRSRYQQLFPQRAVLKRYLALAPYLPELDQPYVHRSRLIPGEPFFRMQEGPGEPNSETRIEIDARLGDLTRYRLEPVTGRKHQLRVHLASLGAPIVNDDFYPAVATHSLAPDDFSRPLKLLAHELAFIDPLDGRPRHFASRRNL